MAVNWPGSKLQLRPSTATWPPKRMLKSLVTKRLTGVPSAAVSAPSGGRAALMVRSLARVADRHIHLLRPDLAHQRGHAPGEGRVDLDPEVVHALHRLVVFLAKVHPALGGVELHALHGLDQQAAVGVALGGLERRDQGHGRAEATGGEKV